MRITITIDTENDAFTDDPRAEVARVLHELAYRVDGVHKPVIYCNAGDDDTVRDINGNTVGAVTITD
jgi:hypothetical protein